MEWTLTRKESVPNQRIVGHVPLGDMAMTFEPEDGGATMSMGWEWAHDVPVAGTLIDRASWDGAASLMLHSRT